MRIETATREFENWLSGCVPLVRSQLTLKHKHMAEDPVQFLRATFYRWAQVWPEVCPDLAKWPTVLAVGDLHIASFGTWRDAAGRLIWGVDDFDEAFPLPYANDLVRLGVSAILDATEGYIGVGIGNVCDVILDGYREGLAAGGQPFVLEENHKWLRRIALSRLDIPFDFWKKMDAMPAARNITPEVRGALESMLPAPGLAYRVTRRIAGDGSLGHPRFVAIVDWRGGRIAIEAKAAAPSACVWTKPGAGEKILYQDILSRAVRCPDPFVAVRHNWLLRRLAPDSSPIDIETMQGGHAQDRLLHAMSFEAANIHLGSPRAQKRILDDLKKRPAKWLRGAVKDMAKATMNDWKEWRKPYR
ncbi:MAG: DUF2252 family protein [Bryobacteraceae bacterium]